MHDVPPSVSRCGAGAPSSRDCQIASTREVPHGPSLGQSELKSRSGAGRRVKDLTIDILYLIREVHHISNTDVLKIKTE